MKTFILAGGFATRLWPLTELRAKPLLPLAGKPLLTHIVEKIPVDGPITVSTNAAFEESFREWAKSQKRPIDIRIEKTRKDEEKLGTNGAVAQWITDEKIDDDVLLITGDNYLGFPMQNFLAQIKPHVALVAACDVATKEKANSFGTILVAADGRTVTGFEEKPANPKTTLVSTGCSFMPAGYLSAVVDYAKTHPDHIGGIFEEFLRRKLPVECFRFTEPWFDVGSFEAYIEATKQLVGSDVLLGTGSTLEETKTDGSVVLGEGSMARQSELTDTVLFDRCIIEDCVLQSCVIDDDCHLKGVDLTGKMIRSGTVLVR